MTKRFENIADDNIEQALRRGQIVPEGAVNLAWVQPPKVNPENNIVIVDTSQAAFSVNNSEQNKVKIAYANALGVLEDENGNQVWEEEYPIVGDVFNMDDPSNVKESDYVLDVALPFLHASRYFHLDFTGLAFGSLIEYLGNLVKVIDKNGSDFVDENEKKKYKIFIVEPNGVQVDPDSRNSVYRIHVFLHVDAITEDLFLVYNKTEITINGNLKNFEEGFKEKINPINYFKYIPEETDVVDQANINEKIFSSKPYSKKQNLLGTSTVNSNGWKYFVPRKAVPDPRVFQLFRWRMACEITRPRVQENTGTNTVSQEPTFIRVGVVVPPGGDHLSTRANFFFHQLNISDFNFTKIQFVNPLHETYDYSNVVGFTKTQAAYWHVDIGSITLDQLSNFDILLWAPSAESIDISPYLPKINYFVEQLGKTFILETSSSCDLSGLTDFEFSETLQTSLIDPLNVTDMVSASTLRIYDATIDNQDDTFGAFGMWENWPPNVSDIINSYTDTGSILSDADVIAGWSLTDQEKEESLSAYQNIADVSFQFIKSYDSAAFRPVLEALNTDSDKTYIRTERIDGTQLTSPDHASLNIDTDLEIVCRVALDNWIYGENQGLIGKSWTTSGEYQYALLVDGDGKLNLWWSTNGTAISTSLSSVVPFSDGQTYWIKVTLDIANGSDRVITFKYAADQDTEPTTWTTLTTNTTNGVTSIYLSGTGGLHIGSYANGAYSTAGKLFNAIIRDGIDGTTVLNADFTALDPDETITDTTGKVITIHGSCSIEKSYTQAYHKTALHKRFNGGGNLFISTSCLFEDHLFDVNGNMASRSLQLSDINLLNSSYLRNLKAMVSSAANACEMKLRLNTMLYSTINKAGPDFNNNTIGTNNSNTQSVTVYSDWKTSWVIDPSNGILAEDEKIKYNFALLPVKSTDVEPTWQRILSDKTAKQIIQEEINRLDPNHTNDLFNSFTGATKRYFIVITNPLVQTLTTDLINDNSIPTAWTKAYSPAFNIPFHLGSYVVRDEMVSGIGPGSGQRVYPTKPYQLQANVSHIDSSIGDTTVTFSLTGRAIRSVTVEESTTTTQVWVPPTADTFSDVVLHWNTDGANRYETKYKHQDGYPKPVGMDTWTSANYYNTLPNNWAYPGIHGFLHAGSSSTTYTITPSTPYPSGYRPVWSYGSRWVMLKNSSGLLLTDTSGNFVKGELPLYHGVIPYEVSFTTNDAGLPIIRTSTSISAVSYYKNYTIDQVFPNGFGQLPTFTATTNSTASSSGQLVKVVQQILNYVIFFGDIAGPGLQVDGVYGSKTAAAVTKFQTYMGARYIDGIVDAETWSLLGYKLIAISNIPGFNDPLLLSYANNAKKFMMLNSLSDDLPETFYCKQSWEHNGPGQIREAFLIKFNERFPIYRISILPYTLDTVTNNLSIDWVDIAERDSLYGYDFSRGFPGNIIGKSGGDGQWINIDVPQTTTNSIIFRAFQSGPAGWGSARFIGIRDVAVYGKKFFPGAAGYYRDVTVTVPGRTYQERVDLSFSATVNFKYGVPQIFSPALALQSSDGSALSNIKWDIHSLDIQPSSTGAFFDVEFIDAQEETEDGQSTILNKLKLTYKGYQSVLSSENFVNGVMIGNGSNGFYTKNTSGAIEQYEKYYGWIKKDDGLRLICDSSGKPFGFPSALPDNVTTSTHFARYKLNAFGTDQTIYYGFYDIQTGEFLVNTFGEPEVSYYDYVRRGPQNIFIAVKTIYELDSSVNVPGNIDSIMRPFRWAMPVYSITSGRQSTIKIEPMSKGLTKTDLWSLPIKTGFFTRDIQLRLRDNGSYTNYLKNYQGTTVKAFYSVPEAKNEAWSSKYGRPYLDIKGETPTIVDESTIKISQYPFLISQVPTNNNSEADPYLPVFTVYRRSSASSPWVELVFSDIKDFDSKNGTITLNSPLSNLDPKLIKVDYTSDKKVYNFKGDAQTKINFNPFLSKNSDFVNKPLYIYLLPESVFDNAGVLISDSIRTRTVNFTSDDSIFNPSRVDFDPTALLIGIVHISTSSDINDLIILDTRKRGGGLSTAFSLSDMTTIQPEAESYWDIISDKAVSYQKGGFVIIRLPAELRDDFTYQQIKDVIERNITIGVAYQIEDLDGNRWVE